ncbi:MAG: Membrane protein containing DUF457, transmembrane [Candidatus Woesebacteria bacterium GW2011_GWB1_38_5b]|uniref:Membrane protein containing DUF457, transmembrane n=1 Tax=Candidatus Woesebacteria bacterium GW2011_GWB1_38_5b TaxID=1618569 RepID=A0A0G0NF13_9BACT|nr:MAG: Membrane protein containing DUF457, transmembrane [Candidatus Woesebacteria bacterium GW2011_GWB1_38_5b]
MTARTHDTFALALLTTAAVYYPPANLNIPTLFGVLVGSVVGSLIPDMDQGSNRLWDMLPAGNTVGKIFRRLFLGHRTISHSLLGFYLFFKFFEFVLPKFLNTTVINTNLVFASIMIGIASHLIADALTKDGIPLFFPLSIKVGIPPIKAFRVKTDTWVEHFLVLPAVVGYLIWIINANQEVLKKLLNNLYS